MSDPNLRAVPNPETNQVRELVKTVALTSAVSALVGVFAVAGGEALFSWIKKAASAKKAKRAEPAQAQAQAAPVPPGRPPPPGNDPYYYGSDHEEEMPEALRMRPSLRNTGRRRRPPSPPPAEMAEIRSWLEEFETRQNEHFARLERRIEEGYEEEEDEEATG